VPKFYVGCFVVESKWKWNGRKSVRVGECAPVNSVISIASDGEFQIALVGDNQRNDSALPCAHEPKSAQMIRALWDTWMVLVGTNSRTSVVGRRPVPKLRVRSNGAIDRPTRSVRHCLPSGRSTKPQTPCQTADKRWRNKRTFRGDDQCRPADWSSSNDAKS